MCDHTCPTLKPYTIAFGREEKWKRKNKEVN